MKILALIPARKGSKRVINKNLKILNDRPLIEWTFDSVKLAANCDKIVLSTDDLTISELAQRNGIEVPFMRPDELASDTAKDIDVIKHALQFYEEKGEVFDVVVYLRPTSPFRKLETIQKCLELIRDHRFSCVRTVTKVSGVHHPYWMYKMDEQQIHSFIDGISVEKYYQSQLLPDCYRLNGCVDVFRTSEIKSGSLYGKSIGSVVIDDIESHDIDTEFDFKIASTLAFDLLT